MRCGFSILLLGLLIEPAKKKKHQHLSRHLKLIMKLLVGGEWEKGELTSNLLKTVGTTL